MLQLTTATTKANNGKEWKRGREKKGAKHTTTCVRWSSPTQLLSDRSVAYLCEIERDREFSTVYGRMYSTVLLCVYDLKMLCVFA